MAMSLNLVHSQVGRPYPGLQLLKGGDVIPFANLLTN